MTDYLSFGQGELRGEVAAPPVRTFRREGPPSSSPTGNRKRMLPAELSPKWLWLVAACIAASGLL